MSMKMERGEERQRETECNTKNRKAPRQLATGAQCHISSPSSQHSISLDLARASFLGAGESGGGGAAQVGDMVLICSGPVGEEVAKWEL